MKINNFIKSIITKEVAAFIRLPDDRRVKGTAPSEALICQQELCEGGQPHVLYFVLFCIPFAYQITFPCR